MVKEIVKNARNAVKNRAIPQNILSKYDKKVKSLEVEVQKVQEEEKAEREIMSLENQTNKLKNRLEGKGENEERAWFKDKKVTTLIHSFNYQITDILF